MTVLSLSSMLLRRINQLASECWGFHNDLGLQLQRVRETCRGCIEKGCGVCARVLVTLIAPMQEVVEEIGRRSELRKLQRINNGGDGGELLTLNSASLKPSIPQ
jgi:hypothetical protein